jgi:hypothetical protein
MPFIRVDAIAPALRDWPSSPGWPWYRTSRGTFLRGLSNRVLELRPGDGGGITARPPFEYGGSYVEFVERTGSEAAGVHGS